MNRTNPRVVIRNTVVAAAIADAEAGDFSSVHALQHAVMHPFDGEEVVMRPDWTTRANVS